MADENKITEDTNTGGTQASGRKSQAKRAGGNPQQTNQPNDAFQEYKANLQETDIPNAENELQMKQETLDQGKNARRIHVQQVNNIEQHLREYKAISFNTTSIMAKDGEEVKTDIEALGTKYDGLKAALAAAREAIKNAKDQLGVTEEKARQIMDAKDDSVHAEQKKLLNRLPTTGGQKNFDQAIKEIVDKADECHNLSDNAREKEIIVEGIAGYITVAGLVPGGAEIKDKTAAFKADVDTNIATAATDADAAKTALVEKLAELSTAAMEKDRSKLGLQTLNETVAYIDDTAEPEENVREILRQVEGTFEFNE